MSDNYVNISDIMMISKWQSAVLTINNKKNIEFLVIVIIF